MKVALVLDDSIDRTDGVQQYVLTLGAFLSRAGHEVHYLSSSAERTDVTVHSLARNVGVTFNGNGLRIPLPASRAGIRAVLERERYDVIHVQTPHSPLFAARVVDEARRLFGDDVRIVGTFHILPDSKVSSWGTHALGRVLRRNLRLFDAFVAVSEPAAAFARSAFGIDARVVPCPVDVSGFAAAAAGTARVPGEDGRLVVAFLGRLVERKGVIELVRALGQLPDDVQDRIEVRLGGRGPLQGELEAAIEANGLERVTLAGFVAEEDKAAFYADADVAVFPATGGESFGIVLVEAMASLAGRGAGVVLAGANPGYLSVIGDDPYVSVDARDAEAFADALEALLCDEELRAALHTEQAARVRRFDVETVGAQVLELYGS
ncbi:glycosyltransferase family 4 protein [Demequina maris]|uniref:glycosyltransferase family 4 protein n=1 Tax=Demequina maris TaxID=1638982 RepID=UPI0007834477|nr:glycosyltransferase family 4 protein [Demequina maris]